MATPRAPASSRKRSTVWSRSSTDGAFRAAAKPMRRVEFTFVGSSARTPPGSPPGLENHDWGVSHAADGLSMAPEGREHGGLPFRGHEGAVGFGAGLPDPPPMLLGPFEGERARLSPGVAMFGRLSLKTI